LCAEGAETGAHRGEWRIAQHRGRARCTS
jgi:hypothetical protein